MRKGAAQGGSRWYVYLLKCRDNTVYTGITTDPIRRLSMHHKGPQGGGSRCVAAHGGPVGYVWTASCPNRSLASKAEYHLKRRVSARQRRRLISGDLKPDNITHLRGLELTVTAS